MVVALEMKTPLDPRHVARIEAVENLFSWGFSPHQKIDNPLAEKVVKNVNKIDKIISLAAPEWPIDQVNRIDLVILRLAVYELMIAKKEPAKVIIDEAVELAKTYGSETSPKFVNGVMGTVYKKLKNNEKHKP